MNNSLTKELESLLDGGELCLDEEELVAYSYDSSFASALRAFKPDAVIKPRDADEVSRVVPFAARHGIPVVPRGAGTCQSGGALPVNGGLVLDMSGMNRILELDLDNLQAVVEPGVVHADLNNVLREHGFFFPPDPGSTKMCTLGGMVANNSSGVRAVKYGATGNYVLGLEVVVASGERITTGGVSSRALKSVSGYDLTRLMVGSEGTLGAFTRIRLKVLPLPQSRGVVLTAFSRAEDAGHAAAQVFRRGILPSAIEILDSSAIRAAKAYRPGLPLPDAGAVLLFEVDGSPEEVRGQAERITGACSGLAITSEWTDVPQEVNALWEARQVVGAAAARLGGARTRVYDGEDICVPISRLPEALARIAAIGEEYGLPVITYGHAGDGNLHAAVMADLTSPGEVERARRVAHSIHALSLELGGTTTGEHGVGLARARFMEAEHGAALALMRAIKRALDPGNIFNPGKMGLD